MSRIAALVIAGIVAASSLTLAQSASTPVKAAGGFDFKDATADIEPFAPGQPALDLVLLSIKSDGLKLTLSATIAGKGLGDFATDVASILIDTDNSATTGIKPSGATPGGFEYKAELTMCVEYTPRSGNCAGRSSGNPKVISRYGAVQLMKFKGDSDRDTADVLDSMGFPGTKAAVRTPATGQIVVAVIEYADLGVKSGQTIRLRARESSGRPKDGDGSFPILLLTLR